MRTLNHLFEKNKAWAERIRRHNPEARIVFVTVNAEPSVVRRSLATGALGYVLKDSAGESQRRSITLAYGTSHPLTRWA